MQVTNKEMQWLSLFNGFAITKWSLQTDRSAVMTELSEMSFGACKGNIIPIIESLPILCLGLAKFLADHLFAGSGLLYRHLPAEESRFVREKVLDFQRKTLFDFPETKKS